MKLQVVWVTARRGDKQPAVQALTEEYTNRLSRFVTTDVKTLAGEEAFLKMLEATGGRVAPFVVVLNSRGKQFTSEEFATFIELHQSRGTQTLLFGVGPADGFSDRIMKSANQLLSLGKLTLPHELARVILLEQLYRAFTIIRNHPYHSGH
jgi:23S rRNA (pseudouridine1915-N3)-methyltransferase